MNARHAPPNPSAPLCLSVEDVAKRCGWTVGYVYKQAKEHGWRRIRQDGQVYYWSADVESARKDVPTGRAGVNPFLRHDDGSDAALIT